MALEMNSRSNNHFCCLWASPNVFSAIQKIPKLIFLSSMERLQHRVKQVWVHNQEAA